MIYGFAANISKIFGTNGKLVVREAQSNGYPAPHLLIVLDEPVFVRRRKGRSDLVNWYIEDPVFLRRFRKDPESRRLSREDHRAAIDSNPVWKHGFFDIVGVVSYQRFGGRKNVCSHLFKYMAKCLMKDNCHSTSSLRTIKDCKGHNLLVALYTHLCNKASGTGTSPTGRGSRTASGYYARNRRRRTENHPPRHTSVKSTSPSS